MIVAYCEQIAEARLASGFELAAIQAAFNVLEEAMWANAVAALDADHRVRAVESISTALGSGRDALGGSH